jgi:hypothetical protein
MSIGRVMLLAIAASSAIAAGCVRHETTVIPHPLASRAVGENRIYARDQRVELEHGLPFQSVVHEASLTKLDEKEACFEVVVRAAGHRLDLATLKNWRISLRGSPNFENTKAVLGAERAPEQATLQGAQTIRQSKKERVCDESGACAERDVEVANKVPAMIPVATGGGSVCFPNRDQIRVETYEIMLHLDDPTTPAQPDAPTYGLAFRWKLVEGPQPTPMAAR